MSEKEEKNNAPNGRVNPYKALNAYLEADKNVFFGREEETERLFQLVRFNCMTVVFGKSGMGKTSLLNAGLFPRLREEDFRPIWIRLNFAKTAPPLKEQIRIAIEDGLAPNAIDKKKVEIESQVENVPSAPLSTDETLWEYFRRVTHYTATRKEGKKSVTPVLVFDQFEEIFTIGKQHKDRGKFIDELHWLLEDKFPPQVTERALEQNDQNAKTILYSNVRSRFKVILSLREDFLPHLNDLKSRIPSIDKTLFRVTHLTGTQARDIIQKPENGFKEEVTVQSILRIFYKKKELDIATVPEEKLEIEPAFLSLLCYRMYEKGMFKAKKREELDKLIEDYYDLTLKDYPTSVHEFIETKLLTEAGFRTPRVLDTNSSLNEYIDKLVEQRILRKFHDGHNEYVEIVHDFLAPIIEKRRSQRMRRKKRRIRSIWGTVIFFLILLSGFALFQWRNASTHARIAQVNRLTAEALSESFTDNTKAIRIAEAAIKQAKSNAEPHTFETLGRIGYSSYNRPFYISVTPLKSNDVIYSAVFSADSKSILTAHDDGTTQIRDLEGNLIRKLEGHKGRVNTAVFSPDETLVLTASSDFTAKLWNRKGELQQEFKHDRDVIRASFSPDGQLIVTASLDNTARLWNLQGEELKVFRHAGRVISASFSPDGNYILTASWDKTAKLWNRDGKLLADLNKHNNTLSSAVFSPDGNYILTASWDKTALLWDIYGKVLATFGHEEALISAQISPNTKYILTAGVDGTVKLWDRESSKWNQNSSKWDQNNWKFKASIKHDGPLSSVSFSSDGHFILAASENGAFKLWDFQENQESQLNKHSQMIRAIAFSPNGHYLFTSSHGETCILWDLKSNILMNLKHNEQVSCAEFSPDGKFLLTTSQDGAATLWDNNGKLLANFPHGVEIFTALFSRKTDIIFTVGRDGTIKRWDRKGNFINTINWDNKSLTDITISKNGNMVITVSKSRFVSLWRLEDDSLKEIAPTFAQEDLVSTVFSHDDSRILTSSKKGRIVLRDLSGKILVEEEKYLPIEDSELVSASFSPDGKRLLTVLNNETVALWDSNGKFLRNFHHDKQIYTAAFSPDGNQVLTASQDRKARLFDLNGNTLATFNHDRAVVSAVFSIDGKRVVTCSQDFTAKVWMTPYAILQWLKHSKIPELTKEGKKK